MPSFQTMALMAPPVGACCFVNWNLQLVIFTSERLKLFSSVYLVKCDVKVEFPEHAHL